MTLSDFLSDIARAAKWAEPGHSCRCAVALLVAGVDPWESHGVDIVDPTVAAHELSEYCGTEVPVDFGMGLLIGFDGQVAEYHDDGSLLGSRRDSSLDARAWLNGFTLGRRLRDEGVQLVTDGIRP